MSDQIQSDEAVLAVRERKLKCLFRCAQCIRHYFVGGPTFHTFSDLERHVNSCHAEGCRFACQDCPFASPDASQAYQHLASAHPNAPPDRMHLCIANGQVISSAEHILLSSLALFCRKISRDSRVLRPLRKTRRRSLKVARRPGKKSQETILCEMAWREKWRCRLCQAIVSTQSRRDEHIYRKHIGHCPYECTKCPFMTTEAGKAGRHIHCRLMAVLDLSQALKRGGLLQRLHAVCWPDTDARASGSVDGSASQIGPLADKVRRVRRAVETGRAAVLRTKHADRPMESSYGVRILQTQPADKAADSRVQSTEHFIWGDQALAAGQSAPTVGSETAADHICKVCACKLTLWRHREYHIRHSHLKIYPYKCSLCNSAGFKNMRGAREHCSKMHNDIGAVVDDSAAVSAHVSAVFGAYFSGHQHSNLDEADFKATVVEELLENDRKMRQKRTNELRRRVPPTPVDLTNLPRSPVVVTVNVAVAEPQATSHADVKNQLSQSDA